MKIIKDKILIFELRKMAKQMFGNLVKQKSLWGINIYPEIQGEEWIEFDSMINLRPSFQNLSRGVDDLSVRRKIRKIVNKLVKR